MTARTARGVAWGATALAASLTVACAVLLAWAGPPAPGAPNFSGLTTGALGTFLIGILLTTLFGGTGALVVGRYPSNLLGWALVVGAVIVGVTFAGSSYGYAGLVARPGSLAAAPVILLLGEVMWLPLVSLQLVALPVLFPDGRLDTPARRRIAWLGIVGVAVGSVGGVVEPRLFAVDVPNPLAVEPRWIVVTIGVIGVVLVIGAGIAAMVSLIGRFRRSLGDVRQQMKWFVFAATMSILVLLPILFTEADALWIQLLGSAAVALVPVSVGIAILRYRLYDIDVVINRTVVYGILAAFITLVFLVLVVGVGALVGGSNTVLAAAAAAVVALVIQPVRRWAQHLANRLVYGERATPYEVLSGFSERLAETYSIDDVLPRTARVLAEGLGAQEVAIVLHDDGARETIARWPVEGNGHGREAMSFEVRHQGELLGEIEVAMPPDAPLDAAREKLVHDVAAQAGLMLRNTSLVADLRASRARLVAAQDQERRRLERNIHDGAQQQLVALAVKLRLADALVGKDDPAAHAMLGELTAETNEALEDLRDLARGIYPPLLADKGLEAALEGHMRRVPFPVAIESGGLGRYPQEVEAAVYFSCLEALQNITKYAHASRVTVRLSQSNGNLTFEVIDDGVGFDPDAVVGGSGLQGIADRLAALGGELTIRSAPGDGTTVAGRLPLALLEASR